MGFKPTKKIYQMSFEDFPGLEISCKGAPLGALMDIAKMRVSINEMDEEKRNAIFEFFAKRLVVWNMEHPELDDEDADTCSLCGLTEGAPMPTTVQGLFCLDLEFVMKIIFGWMTSISRVDAPKEMSGLLGEMSTDTLMKRLGELQSPSKLPEPNLS